MALILTHFWLQSTRRHLTKKLENLDWRLDEEIETTNLIANNVRGELPSSFFLILIDITFLFIHKYVDIPLIIFSL